MIKRKLNPVWVTSDGMEYVSRADAVEAEVYIALVRELEKLIGLTQNQTADIARHLMRSPRIHIMTTQGEKK